MINIEELTIGEARKLAALFQNQPAIAPAADKCPWRPGKNYFVRTVTHHHTGKLVGVTQHELVLENAAWIADDGRLTDALTKCTFSEVEMFPKGTQVIIGRGSIIDAVEITSIPESQK